MFGKRTHLSHLEARKQLLVAESNLNRVQLRQEWDTMAHGVRDLAHHARTILGWVSTVALLMAGVKAWRRGASAPTASKSSWAHRLLNGARVAWTAWHALSPPVGKRPEVSERRPIEE